MIKIIKNLADPVQYDSLQQQWEHRWGRLVERTGQWFDWQTPWIDATLGNGTKLRDGNPVFSAVSHGRRRAVRIIQDDYAAREVNYWFDVFAQGEPEELDELVITCPLYQESIIEACDMIEEWLEYGSLSKAAPRIRQFVAAA